MNCPLLTPLHFQVSHNQLESLPEDMQKLQKLLHLDVSNNRIKALPQNIHLLKALRTLNASNNKIEQVFSCLT